MSLGWREEEAEKGGKDGGIGLNTLDEVPSWGKFSS